jgi:hypothetical protein
MGKKKIVTIGRFGLLNFHKFVSFIPKLNHHPASEKSIKNNHD